MNLNDFVQKALGLGMEAKELTMLQVSLRAVIVFVVALVLVRLADKRFLSKMTAFDVTLGFILASSLARAINGSAPFLPTLVMGFVLIGLHRLLAWLAVHHHGFGKLVKGGAEILVEEGKLKTERMRRYCISERDILEAARENGKVETLEQIHSAVFERNGSISIIPVKG